jgi:hypothetical protein
MLLLEILASLAKPEIIVWKDSKVIVNPTPGMLDRTLKEDRFHEARVIALGDDIAICPAWRMIHQDIGAALAHQSHPSWQNRSTLWWMGEGCWFLHKYSEGPLVNDQRGQIIPPERWPLALKRALHQ